MTNKQILNKNINPILESSNISKFFREGSDKKIQVLNNVNFSISHGEIIAIMGASGSGKSTLLHILGLLDIPDKGFVTIDGEKTKNLSENQRNIIRNRKLGFVYQFHHLLSEFSILENVAMPLIIRRQKKCNILEKAEHMLSLVGLSKRLNSFPTELSGGECQRVALARALINNPICVLADEPTGNLDKKTANCIFDLLVQMNLNFKTAFIFVTHDIELASLADKKLIMKQGNLFVNSR
ncbi:MAG: ATP-binding cassette domain-containing protein [Bordetella sp.]|nr:MAG: ATP-binding cassette domain-containing protein [Bordetella sp.]